MEFPHAEPFTPSLPRPNVYFAEASAESEDEMTHPEGVASLLPPDFQSSLDRPELELSTHSPRTYLPPHCAVCQACVAGGGGSDASFHAKSP